MGLPGFNALTMVNISALCATSRLLQARMLGTLSVSVKPKFQKDPAIATDLSRDDFDIRKRFIAEMEAAMKENSELRQAGFTPILYAFELWKGCAKTREDWGGMVWVDNTLTRFLLVVIGGQPVGPLPPKAYPAS